MTREEIIKIARSYIDQSMDGLEIENPKCDFKSTWYDLSAKNGINEFLKDTSSIANTFGLDGLLIIGYDNKTNTFYDTSFKESKLNDSSLISDLINKKVDRLFEISIYDAMIVGHSLSIVHIPPSLDKPHVIKNYQTFDKLGNIKKEEEHKIFVRKGTTTRPASKNDIELMFYDRKNIIPEHQILSSFHTDSLILRVPGAIIGGKKQYSGIEASIPLTLENTGRRPVSIIEISLVLTTFENAASHHRIELISSPDYKTENITIQPNMIVCQTINFKNTDNLDYETADSLTHRIKTNNSLIKTNTLNLRLSDGKLIQSKLALAKN